jgi:hypothetical protein
MNPMNWINEHLQVILTVAGVIAYWLTQRRSAEAEKAEAEKEAAERRAQPTSLAEAEAADESRAERVREEIRRKIAARRSGGEPVAPERPAPVETEDRPFQLPPLMRPLSAPVDTFGGPARPPVRRVEAVRPVEPPVLRSSESMAASLARQEELAEKLRELTEQRAIAERRAKTAAVSAAVETRRQEDARPIDAQGDLKDPRSLRRAIILREVLGPPVALR